MKLTLLCFFFMIANLCVAQKDVQKDVYDKNIEDIIKETPVFSIGLSLSVYSDIFNKSNYVYTLKQDAFLEEKAKFKVGGMLSTLLLMKLGKKSRGSIVFNLPVIDFAVKASTTYNEGLPLGFGVGLAYRLKPIYICAIINMATYEKMTAAALAIQNFPIAQNQNLSVGAVVPRDLLARYFQEEKRFFLNIGVIFTTDAIKAWTR